MKPIAYTLNDNLVDDTQLLARIRAGDKAACAICIEQHSPQVYRLALRLMQNEADAEDVMQETFLSAFQAIDNFEGRSTISTWLFRIAYNAAMSRLRRPVLSDTSVEDTLDSSEDGALLPTQFFDWCCLPEEDFRMAEVQSQLEQAMRQLSPTLRSVFILRELEGLSVQEAAEALDVSQDVIKTRLHRARLFLREQLSTYFQDYQTRL
jgi:RNA polymerase sigma-70 factor (ECF subfamily)